MNKKPEKEKDGLLRGAKDAKREDEERYRGLFDRMAEGYAYCRIIHEKGRAQDWAYISVNDSFEKLTGWKGVVGKRATEVMPDIRETQPALFETCSRVALTGQPEKLEMFVEAMQKWFSVSVFSPEEEFFAAIFHEITERKETETKLRESMEYFRTVANFTYDWEYWLDNNRRILYTSPSCERITGYNAAKFERDSSLLEKIIHHDDRPLYVRHMREEFQKTEPASLDFRIVTAGGEVRWINHACQRVHDMDGRPMGRRASNRDITQRRQMEQALRENESILTMSEEVAQTGSWRWDLRTKKAVWSDQMFRLFEVKREDFDGDMNRVIAERVHPDDAQAVLEFNRSILTGISSIASLTYRIVLPNGTERTLRTHGKLVRDEAGHPISMTGYVQEVTEWVRVRNQLFQMKRLYAVLSEVNQVIIRVKDLGELYQSICDVIVKYGELAAAWIELLDETLGELRPVSAAGLDVKKWPLPLVNINGEFRQNEVILEALRTSRVATSEDIQIDERTKGLHKHFGKFEFHSLASIPFQSHGKTIGVLNLLSAEVGWFKDEEEIHLLDEMGRDVSFALDALENEKVKRLWEEALRESEEKMRSIFRVAPTGIGVVRDRVLVDVNSRICEMTGYAKEELVGQSARILYPTQEDFDFVGQEKYRQIAQGGTGQVETCWRKIDGSIIDVLLASTPIDLADLSKGVTFTALDITERKQAERVLRESEDKFRKAFMTSPDSVNINRLQDGMYISINPGFTQIMGYTEADVIGKTSLELSIWENPEERARLVEGLRKDGFVSNLEARFRRKDGVTRYGLMSASVIELGGVPHILSITRDITERKQAEEIIHQSERQMKALVTSLDDIVFEFDEDGTYLNIWTADENLLARPKSQMLGKQVFEVMGREQGASFYEAIKRVLAAGVPETVEYPLDVVGGQRWFMARVSPILAPDGSRRTASILIRDITGRKQVEEQVQVQLQRMRALNEIDRAISSGLDMRLSLDILLDQALSQLGVDAACVLLLDSSSQALEYAIGKGFRLTSIRRSRVLLGQEFAGQAGLERRLIHVADLNSAGSQFLRGELLKGEEFVEYFGVPLIAKGMLKGVLEIFHRSHLDPDLEWMNYLETLGGQAAIAIDNAQLFERMERSNMELIAAYDATIEGWSHAMDLRDKETEGHTQRVTKWTEELAKRMSISRQEIVHMRRGALLHDIGKLGVPDHILNKPDKLDEAEWAIMRQHPNHAFDMLMSIHYLRPSLDIPCCHHEKWDGSGYPRQLKGEEIPLAARIFAVVDVWDAMRSDRPYRTSWPADKVRELVIEQSGRHFDPQVVEAFLSLMEESPDLF